MFFDPKSSLTLALSYIPVIGIETSSVVKRNIAQEREFKGNRELKARLQEDYAISDIGRNILSAVTSIAAPGCGYISPTVGVLSATTFIGLISLNSYYYVFTSAMNQSMLDEVTSL